MKRRNAIAILVILAALGGGVAAYCVPLSLLERGVTASGLAGLFPAVAAPLGSTARAVLVLASGLLASALAAVTVPGWLGGGSLNRESTMTFIFSRMTAFMRGDGYRRAIPAPRIEASDAVAEPVPVLRRSDAHPDAPPRPPLFARRDLGDEALPPVGEEWEEAVGYDSAPEVSMPRTPEPLPWETIQQEMERLVARAERAGDDGPGGLSSEETGLEGLSIRELTNRLERGLARRRGMPVPQPDAVQTQDDDLEEAEDAPSADELGSALETLRRLAARTG
ncbi:MAG: hypothetical protein AB7U35_09630 [Sphingobium sp.]